MPLDGRSTKLQEVRRTMSDTTDSASRHKCAYEECKCQVPSTQKYCSDYCSDADGVVEVELQCECKHAPCALD